MAEAQDLQELKDIGINIKSMRTHANVSQYILARNINISQTHLSNIENGKTGVSLGIAIRISQSLNCSLDNLIFGPKGVAAKREPNDRPLSECTESDLREIVRNTILDIFLNSLRKADKAAQKN